MITRIQLVLDGRVIESQFSDAIDEPIVVGRSQACQWRVPAGDSSVGRQHVKIFRKRRSVWVEDQGSRNGTFFRGRRVPRARLQPGSRVTFGRCAITCERAAEEEVIARDRRPEIRVQSGARKGQRFPLGDDEFVVGSDPAAALVLMDDLLVSHRHATIHKKPDGGFWIVDTESTNGTRVNNQPLERGKERLLQNGDRIDIAHVELLFDDGTVRSRRARLLPQVVAVSLTLLVAYSGYLVYRHCTPSAQDWLVRAGECARLEDFATARSCLDKACRARKARDRERDRLALLSRVDVWERTAKRWREVEAAVKDEALWRAATTNEHARKRAFRSRPVSLCSETSRDAWTWAGTDGGALKTQAEEVGELANLAMGLTDAVTQPNARQRRLVEDFSEELESQLEELEDRRDEAHLKPLVAYSTYWLERAEEKLSHWKDFDGIMSRLSDEQEWPPDFPSLKEDLKRLEKLDEFHAGINIRRLIGVIVKLEEASEEIKERVRSLRQLEFAEARRTIEFPSIDDCGLHQDLSALRDMLTRSFGGVERFAMRVAPRYREWCSLLPASEGVQGFCDRWTDEKTLAEVFGCDCLARGLPKRMRENAAGLYDTYLGIGVFYATISSLSASGEHEIRVESTLPWTLELARARQIFDLAREIRSNLSGANRRQPSPVLRSVAGEGKFRAWLADVDRVLGFETELVGAMCRRARESEGREALIAGGIALLVSSTSKDRKLDGVSLREWVIRKRRELYDRVAALEREYELASPEKQIELRQQILKTGLPGNRKLVQFWIQLNSAP